MEDNGMYLQHLANIYTDAPPVYLGILKRRNSEGAWLLRMSFSLPSDFLRSLRTSYAY